MTFDPDNKTERVLTTSMKATECLLKNSLATDTLTVCDMQVHNPKGPRKAAGPTLVREIIATLGSFRNLRRTCESTSEYHLPDLMSIL